MATAARVFVWAARGNRTVDVGRLCGPRHGTFVPPPYLAARVSRDEFDLADRVDRDAVYRLLLCHGTAEDITRWVNLQELARSLDDLCLAAHVAAPWRHALRALGLAPVDEPADQVQAVNQPLDQPVGPVPVHRCDLDGLTQGRMVRPEGSGPGPNGGPNGEAPGRRPTVPAA
ncbi:MAG TPA: hypothetical protein VIR27_04010 [Mycobacteriales bacterium]